MACFSTVPVMPDGKRPHKTHETTDKMRPEYTLAAICAFALAAGCNRTQPPAPYGAIPSPAQVEWQKMETNMFVHFGPNTFTSAEWGDGTESADIFNPTAIDCRQWAAIAKAAGMKGIIITAKHHDGFCLWPNPASSHTVAQSSWRDGKGDVLKDLSEACREYGLKFGVYISPWDRNDPSYGSDEYNDVFCRTLESALGSYGEVFEQWFDGACGEGPNGKRQVYDWDKFHNTVYSLQPDAVIFSDIGPGCRWIGNERGIAGETCWSRLDTEGFVPGGNLNRDTLSCGNVHGHAWVPGEADVSIRPGWFYRASEDDKVKTLDQLLEIYYGSVGRNSLLLLNVPPDKRGLIHSADSLRLMEFRAALDSIFSKNLAEGSRAEASCTRGGSRRFSAGRMLDGDYDTYWATDDGIDTATVTVILPETRTFNRVMLQEYIPLGQRIAAFSIEARVTSGVWEQIAEGTTIGYKRILLTARTTADAVRIRIEKSYACPLLNGFGLYLDDVMYGGAASQDSTSAAADIQKKHIISVKASDPYIIDLGKAETARGFFYEPGDPAKDGCLITFSLETSLDGKTWSKVFEDKMFDNIVNNPVRQEIMFVGPIETRYLRIIPGRTSLQDRYGIADLGIL